MVSTDERTTVELLAERLIRDSNVAALRDVLTGQIEMVTRLEATNAALREFVAADDAELAAIIAYGTLSATKDPATIGQLATRYVNAQDRKREARQTLATDHGIPLPGEGVS